MAGPAWAPIEFDFVATGSATNGTMHFRFGPSAGDVYLDDVRVTDTDVHQDLIALNDFEAGEQSFTQAWTYWPPGAANAVGKITGTGLAAPTF